MADWEDTLDEDHGAWECPKCGLWHVDPESTVNTVCGNGHLVTLTEIDEKGERKALLIEAAKVSK